jgi:hypothetical protein
MARVVLVYDDPAFLEALAAALRVDGHHVVTFDELLLPVGQLRVSDELEVAIVHTKGKHPGLRFLITGVPRGPAYKGPLAGFLTGTVTISGAVTALRDFLTNVTSGARQGCTRQDGISPDETSGV